MRVLAVLDTMYNWKSLADGHQQSPRAFAINPRNHTGKRLYNLIGPGNELLVTNCCKEIGHNSSSHGKPDVDWLKSNLQFLEDWFDLVLICGNVASKTYEQTGLNYPNVITMLHPAARTWTKQLIQEMKERINSLVV